LGGRYEKKNSERIKAASSIVVSFFGGGGTKLQRLVGWGENYAQDKSPPEGDRVSEKNKVHCNDRATRTGLKVAVSLNVKWSKKKGGHCVKGDRGGGRSEKKRVKSELREAGKHGMRGGGGEKPPTRRRSCPDRSIGNQWKALLVGQQGRDPDWKLALFW